MRIATLNVQNLRLLTTADTRHLHGAWDSDDPEAETLDPIDRRLTAKLISHLDADVVVLQEVFDLETLEYFHDTDLLATGTRPYRHRICLPGNDGRGLDVALLSRRRVDAVKSHAALTPDQLDLVPPPEVNPDLPVFRRDCLMVTIGRVTLFACHFKSAYPDPETAWATRRLEALATRRIIERRFEAAEQALWLIIGDLNEPDTVGDSGPRAIRPLEAGFSVDLLQRLPQADRWTYYDRHSGKYHCPDALLASPALARLWPDAKPVVVRKGLGTDSDRAGGPHYADVGRNRPHASDHAAVVIDLEGL
ncbi:endonuclease/exonuclease/phosphatase family protein [Roseivivax sp. CAU 1753]